MAAAQFNNRVWAAGSLPILGQLRESEGRRKKPSPGRHLVIWDPRSLEDSQWALLVGGLAKASEISAGEVKTMSADMSEVLLQYPDGSSANAALRRWNSQYGYNSEPSLYWLDDEQAKSLCKQTELVKQLVDSVGVTAMGEAAQSRSPR